MSTPVRRRARTDSNQSEIVAAFRQAGASVAITSALGHGFPDLVVGFRGRNLLVEVKPGDAKDPRQHQLSEDEQRFVDGWRGQYQKVESIEDALALLFDVARERGGD